MATFNLPKQILTLLLSVGLTFFGFLHSEYFYIVGFILTIVITFYYYKEIPVNDQINGNHVVLISGCDSGLGFSLAVFTHGLGLSVIAACLDADGEGSRKLREQCGEERLHVVAMDVTDVDGVKTAVEKVKLILEASPLLELKAIVNNAAVMVFGEFEWQTEKQIRQQVEVNLLGTMRVTKAFCSMIRRYQGRIIVVSSHCAAASLPGLATYGATKGALKCWADSLRVEEGKYGVPVINFVPGSFIDKSNIMARHNVNAQEMEAAMTAEDKQHYGDYFHTFHLYLSALSDPSRKPNTINDTALHAKFKDALTSRNPKSHYVHGPLRYTIYHFLFKITPTWLRDRLVVRFVQMPAWENKRNQKWKYLSYKL